MIQLINDVKKNHNALFTMVLINLKTTVATSRLGWLWWIIDPLFMMMIYYFIVSMVFQRGGENYHLFILCGIVIWQFFSRTLNISANAILQNRDLIRQIGLPISIMIAIPSLVQMFFAAIGILIIMIWNYSMIGLQSLAIIPLLILVVSLTYGIGIFLSVSSVFFKDTREFIGYFIKAGFFLTPILYPTSRIYESTTIPEIAKIVFSLNPMAWIIPAFRQVLLDGVMYNWSHYFLLLGISLAIVQLSLLWLRLHTPKLVKML